MVETYHLTMWIPIMNHFDLSQIQMMKKILHLTKRLTGSLKSKILSRIIPVNCAIINARVKQV